MMRKSIALLLILTLTLTLFAGCGGGSDESKSTASAPQEADERVYTDADSDGTDAAGAADLNPEERTIGLVQIVEHLSLNQIRDSMMEELNRLGYGDLSVDYRNAQNDMSNLNTIVQTFVGNEVDAIVAIATPSAISAAAATQDIPVIFSAVTDPVASGLVDDLNAPDGNVTGTSDAIPVDLIFGLAAQLTPDAKTFGFVYNLGESNSVSVIEDAKAYCDANGLSYLEATVTDTSEVQQAALSLVGKVDAFFTPIDNTVADGMPIYAQVAIDAGVPIYPGADSMVIEGGFATFGIDYTALGAETAKMVVQVLEGTPVSQLPVVTLTDFRPVINTDTAEALGIDVSAVENAELVVTE